MNIPRTPSLITIRWCCCCCFSEMCLSYWNYTFFQIRRASRQSKKTTPYHLSTVHLWLFSKFTKIKDTEQILKIYKNDTLPFRYSSFMATFKIHKNKNKYKNTTPYHLGTFLWLVHLISNKGYHKIVIYYCC